jgi:hypothetical protein
LFNEANVLRSWYNQVFQSVQSIAAAAADNSDIPENIALRNDSSLPPFISRAFSALEAADAALNDLETLIVSVKALLLQFCR